MSHKRFLLLIFLPVLLLARIERIVIAGLTRKPDAITLATGSLEDSVTLGFDYDPKRQVLTVRKPDVPVCDSFVMALVEVAPA